MHSYPSRWKWCSAPQMVSKPSLSIVFAKDADLSKTVASCSSGNHRSFAGVPAYPMSSMSTQPAYRTPNLLIMMVGIIAQGVGGGSS